MDKIWITWEKQPRNRSMANTTNSELFELISKKPRLIRYMSLSIKTTYLIIKKRPRVVFCQNPSIVLALLCIIIGKTLRHKTVVDQHNSGIFPLEGKSRFLQPISDFIVKHADVSIVSNHYLTKHIEDRGGKPVVIPDPIPNLDASPPSAEAMSKLQARPAVTVICGWAKDEPYEVVLSAAQKLADSCVQFMFTGTPPEHVRHSKLPPNVKLLGFVSKQDYNYYVRESDLTVILTLRENCLNCGAYETLAAGTPGILSDTAALREYFAEGFMFASPDPDSLVMSINSLLARDKNEMKAKLKNTKSRLSSITQKGNAELSRILQIPQN